MAKTSGLHVFVSVTALHADLTWSFAIRGFVHQNNVESVTTVARGMCVCVCVCVWGEGGGGGGGKSGGGKKKKPKKTLGLPKNLPKTPGPRNKSPKIS